MFIPQVNIFCINLDRSPERWQRVAQNFNTLGQRVNRFPAVDGKLLTDNDTPSLWIPVEQYGRGIAGCALSHYNIWNFFLSTDLEYICVLEDDAIVNRKIENITVPDDFEVLYLSDRINSYAGKAANGCGTEAYIVNRTGAEKLIAVCEDMRVPVDLRIQAHMRGFIEIKHPLCNGQSSPDHPFHSLKNPDIIIEAYRVDYPFTTHMDYGVSYVNG